MQNTLTATLATALLFVATSSTLAAGWGTLKGRFVVDGKPPEPPPLAVDNKDPFCFQNKPKNDTLVIGKDNGLANVVVYLRLPRRGNAPIHPDYEAKMKEPAVLDNQGCSFHPHITLVRVNQDLTVKNSDPTGHNTNLSMFGQNPTVPAMSELKVKATKETPLPQPVQCNIHPFMKGHLLCLKHPYMVASADDGTFEIKNLPAGKHEFQLWHEGPGYLKDLKLKSGKTNRQGRTDLTIADGQTLDLGDIKVPAAALKK
jgi:hypothetical protein